MSTLLNVCPNCKSTNVEGKRSGKYTGAGCLLIIIGLPLLFAYGIGILFIIAGIVMGAISETTHKCRDCKAEWK